MNSANPSLFLENLSNKEFAFSSAYGECLAQAGAVCLEDQGHSCGVALSVNGDFQRTFLIYWSPATEPVRSCWNDLEYATEHGAYGLALLIIYALTGLKVIERARKGTGFDYWLGNQNGILFQDKTRLEVSGIRKGNKSAVNTRLKQKIQQIQRSGSALPAYIVVVEFSQPESKVAKS